MFKSGRIKGGGGALEPCGGGRAGWTSGCPFVSLVLLLRPPTMPGDPHARGGWKCLVREGREGREMPRQRGGGGGFGALWGVERAVEGAV